MKTVKYDTLGLEIGFSVPETVEEYNASAPARVNPVLEDAVDNVVYRSSLAKFRKNFIAAVVAKTGVKRKTKSVTKGNNEDGTPKTVEVVDDTEKDYFDNVVLTEAARLAVSEEVARAGFFEDAQKVADAVAWDATSESRGQAVRKPTKEAMAHVAALRANGKFEAAAAKLGALYGVDAPTTDEALGLLIAEHFRAEQRKAAAAAASALNVV